MLLYHGTTADHLPGILKNGLCPRGGDRGHWEKYPSRADCVYLTTSYPFFFAMAIKDIDSQRLVIEIDSDRLDQSNLLPDEDFIVQGIANSRNLSDSQSVVIDDIHDEVRENLELFSVKDLSDTDFQVGILEDGEEWDGPKAWEASVKYMTTCCHRGSIPPSAFTRYCLFNHKKRPLLTAMAYSSGVRLCGPHQHHQNLTSWFFGNRKKLPRFVPKNFLVANEFGEFEASLRNHDWKREEKRRQGVEVVVL